MLPQLCFPLKTDYLGLAEVGEDHAELVFLKLQSQFFVCQCLPQEPLTLCVLLFLPTLAFFADHFFTSGKALGFESDGPGAGF